MKTLPVEMVADIRDMLAREPGLTAEQARAGLRGGVSAFVFPSSKRRWRSIGGTSSEWEQTLEANGFRIVVERAKTGRQTAYRLQTA